MCRNPPFKKRIAQISYAISVKTHHADKFILDESWREMSTYTHNLSQGNILKNIIRFSLPILLSNIVQSLYNVADMLIVGNFCGAAAMSGVNIGGQVTFILTNTVFGLCTGATVLIAQYIGAKNEERIESTIATVLTLLIGIGLFITISVMALKQPILRLLQTPAESFKDADEYLTVTLIGIVFIFTYNALSAILRGMGDSKKPFLYVTIACVTNIVLDLWFVAGLGWGAFGAAVATVISQALSVVLCVLNMIKNKFYFDFKPRSFKINKKQMGLIFKIGLPSCIQNGVVSLSFLFITALVNGFGVWASAAAGAAGKFNSFAIMPAIAMSASVSTISAQSIGAEKWDRAVKTCMIGSAIAMAISLTMFVLVQIFPAQIMAFFGKEPEMIEQGVIYMRTFSFDYLVVPLVFCFNGLFIGAGHTMFSLMTGLLSSLVLRVPVSYLFGIVFKMGLSGVGLGAPVASIGSLVIILIFFFSGKWKRNVVSENGPIVLE